MAASEGRPAAAPCGHIVYHQVGLASKCPAASTHLGVAHICIRGQAHRGAVRAQRAPAPRRLRLQAVQGGRIGAVHRIVLVVVPAKPRKQR